MTGNRISKKGQEKMEEKTKKDEKVEQISVNLIAPNPNQPRKAFDEDGILKLADSIRQFGIIQPLVVRKTGELYELVAGERRLRAAKELGLKDVPCIVSSITEIASAEISIIENLLRQDLNIFEQASAIQVLIDTYGLTQEQVAEKLSNSQSFVANKLRLLRLSNSEREKILASSLSERHARALLRIFDPQEREKVLNQIIEESLNVSKTEELIDSIVKKEKNAPQKRYYKDVSSFYIAISRAIDQASSSGFKIKSRKIENDSFTELTILIPKELNPKNTHNEPESHPFLKVLEENENILI